MFAAHFRHHGRFYFAMLVGAAVFAIAAGVRSSLASAAGGDAFFAAYLGTSWFLVFRQSSDDLKARAAIEDEGALLVILIALAVVGFTTAGVFRVLNHGHDLAPPALVLVLAQAPLGWAMLHTIGAYHYANLHYFDSGATRSAPPLKFPATAEPGPWDFIYFSFVVGMTTQVSDVLVQTTGMRRAVTAHSVVSFFFNTVLIALAVNAVVAKMA